MTETTSLLEIENLKTYFDVRGHVARAVDDVKYNQRKLECGREIRRIQERLLGAG